LIAVVSPYRSSSREVWSHSRRETAWVLGLTAFLGFTGLSLLFLSIQQLNHTAEPLWAAFPVQVSPLLIQLFGVIVAVNFCLTIFVRYEAGVLQNPALRLNASQLLRHAWLTLIVFMALIGMAEGYVWLDPLVAFVLILLLIPSFWWVLNWQLPLFVRQVAIAPEVLAQIAKQIEGVARCDQVRSWGIVGRHIVVEMRITLHPDSTDLSQAIAKRIEDAIRQHYGPVQVRLKY
jgi:divalent metal cation (Fe/Co/Zn/Cd) transporter